MTVVTSAGDGGAENRFLVERDGSSKGPKVGV